MFWTKKKKTKEEVIHLEEPMEEEIHVEEVLPKSLEEIKEEIKNQHQYIQKNWTNFYRNFLISRFLIKINLRPTQSDEQLSILNQRIQELKTKIEEFNEQIQNIDKKTSSEIDELEQNSLSAYAYMRGMESQINELFTNFSEMKISSVHIFMNKSEEELEKLFKNIEEEGKEYSNYSQAADAVYYYSGDFLTNLVHHVVSLIEMTKNEKYIHAYPFSFFLPSEVVVTLSIKEWIDLYNHIKFSLKNYPMQKSSKYQKFIQELEKFEAKYTILMIRAENSTSKYA